MKVLILEDDAVIPYDIQKIIDTQLKNDEIEYITNVYNAGKTQIVETAKWAEAILFQTTFYYQNSIGTILGLILKIGKPYKVFIRNYEAQKEMGKLLTDKECYAIQQKGIKLYQVNSPFDDIYLNEFNFNDRAKEYKVELDRLTAIEVKRLQYIQSAASRPTGRKICICKVNAFGPQWSKLKEGDIVDEVDMDEVETNFSRGRGVWIMGLSEGVKLLNEHPHKEYEIVTEMSGEEFVTEILTSVSKNDVPNLIRLAIRGIITQVNAGELLIDDASTDILDILGVERRGNRFPLRKLLHSKLKEPVEA